MNRKITKPLTLFFTWQNLDVATDSTCNCRRSVSGGIQYFATEDCLWTSQVPTAYDVRRSQRRNLKIKMINVVCNLSWSPPKGGTNQLFSISLKGRSESVVPQETSGRFHAPALQKGTKRRFTKTRKIIPVQRWSKIERRKERGNQDARTPQGRHIAPQRRPTLSSQCL